MKQRLLQKRIGFSSEMNGAGIGCWGPKLESGTTMMGRPGARPTRLMRISCPSWMSRGAIGKKASRVETGTIMRLEAGSGSSQGKVTLSLLPRFKPDNGRQLPVVCLNLLTSLNLSSMHNPLWRRLLNLRLNCFKMMRDVIGPLALRQDNGTSMSMMAGIQPRSFRGKGASSLKLVT